MAKDNQNQRITYKEGVDFIKIIFEVLKDNGLEEAQEEIDKKWKENKIPRYAIINRLTLEAGGGKISNSELASSLQTQLEISSEAAKKLADDIIAKLVTLTEKFTDEAEDEEEPTVANELDNFPDEPGDSEVFPGIRPLSELPGIENIETIPVEKTTVKPLEKNNIISPLKSKKNLEERINKVPEKTTPKIARKDNYREPIE